MACPQASRRAFGRVRVLTLFPASLEDLEVGDPPLTYRFRDPGSQSPTRPLPDWWSGDDRPLVYVTFGSVTASVPPAAAIYGVALEAVAGLPARVLLTTGTGTDAMGLAVPGPHVHIARWVPQADVLPRGRRIAAVGAGVVVEPRDAEGIRTAVDPAALHDAIAAVLADDTFTHAADGIAAEIRGLPAADEALRVLAAVT